MAPGGGEGFEDGSCAADNCGKARTTQIKIGSRICQLRQRNNGDETTGQRRQDGDDSSARGSSETYRQRDARASKTNVVSCAGGKQSGGSHARRGDDAAGRAAARENRCFNLNVNSFAAIIWV